MAHQLLCAQDDRRFATQSHPAGKQLRRRLTERLTVVVRWPPKGSEEERWRRALDEADRIWKGGARCAHDHPVFLTPDKERVVVVRSLTKQRLPPPTSRLPTKRVVLG